MAVTSAVKMLEPFVSVQACSWFRVGTKIAQVVVSGVDDLVGVGPDGCHRSTSVEGVEEVCSPVPACRALFFVEGEP
jgi:hypothetical protein